MSEELKSEVLLGDNHNVKLDGFINEVLMFADYIDLKDFTNLKLQKLLYYCYSVYAWINNAVPFEPKYLRFWALGPVLKPAYDAFKNYGSKPLIDHNRSIESVLLKDVNDATLENPNFETVEVDDKHKENVRKSVVYVLRTIGLERASKLVERTHKKDHSAWSKWYDCTKQEDKYHNKRSELKMQEQGDKLQKSLQKLDETLIDNMMEELAYYGFFAKEADRL